MKKRDYYEVLGVDKSADDKKLKSAYRKLAKKYHPDANPGNKEAERKFKEVGEAYAVLSDPEKRKQYDSYGFAAFEGPDPSQHGYGGTSGFNTGNGGFESFHFDGKDAEDLFESMFGDLFGRRGSTRGGFRSSSFGDDFGSSGPFSSFGGFGGRQKEELDLHTSLTIDFKEAALGCTKTIRLSAADGSGSQTLEIAIPAGIDEGKTMRLRGKGHTSSSGRTGDLLIEIHIAADSTFTRKGIDIYTTALIPFTTAALGGEAVFPTLFGNVSCKIPAGIRSGKQIRLKGKGIRKAATAGDEYVEVQIEVPKNLTAKEKKLLQEFAELRAGKDGAVR